MQSCKMTAKSARPDQAQPFLVIEEAEIFLDLDVSEVMPVAGEG